MSRPQPATPQRGERGESLHDLIAEVAAAPAPAPAKPKRRRKKPFTKAERKKHSLSALSRWAKVRAAKAAEAAGIDPATLAQLPSGSSAEAATTKPRGGGTISSYTPAVPGIVLALLQSGQAVTLEEVAASLGISIRALYAWAQAHPELQQAIEIGRTAAAAMIIGEGRGGMRDKEFRGDVWRTFAAHVAGWRDRQEVAVAAHVSVGASEEVLEALRASREAAIKEEEGNQ